MSEPVDTCLQCGETRAAVKAHGYFCATVDYYGECQDEWPRHRWADWSNAELSRLGILPEFMGLYRRHNIESFRFIRCDHQGREHKPGDKELGIPDHICVGCFTDIREVAG